MALWYQDRFSYTVMLSYPFHVAWTVFLFIRFFATVFFAFNLMLLQCKKKIAKRMGTFKLASSRYQTIGQFWSIGISSIVSSACLPRNRTFEPNAKALFVFSVIHFIFGVVFLTVSGLCNNIVRTNYLVWRSSTPITRATNFLTYKLKILTS